MVHWVKMKGTQVKKGYTPVDLLIKATYLLDLHLDDKITKDVYSFVLQYLFGFHTLFKYNWTFLTIIIFGT